MKNDSIFMIGVVVLLTAIFYIRTKLCIRKMYALRDTFNQRIQNDT